MTNQKAHAYCADQTDNWSLAHLPVLSKIEQQQQQQQRQRQPASSCCKLVAHTLREKQPAGSSENHVYTKPLFVLSLG